MDVCVCVLWKVKALLVVNDLLCKPKSMKVNLNMLPKLKVLYKYPLVCLLINQTKLWLLTKDATTNESLYLEFHVIGTTS